MRKSSSIVCGMAAGAVLGAAALHLNPFGAEADAWLLAPVALFQLGALLLHDSVIEPPGGWPAALREPLHPGGAAPAVASGSVAAGAGAAAALAPETQV
mmetsp:Transcript_39606/g.118327  ORF Transcript_39606/g.118327 Transcript_39606/m.118327 type:complete len:99 (-) Transcript_39606:13-309(-)